MWRMNTEDNRPISFPPIHGHGVIGDRRTGAMVAADGTLNWFCVPNFDSPPLFGALLDPKDGGFCRFGPARASLGQQRYLAETAAVVTSWRGTAQESGELELTDMMAWPADERPESARDQRIIVRRLRAREASVACFEVRPRWEFGDGPEEVRATPCAATFHFAAARPRANYSSRERLGLPQDSLTSGLLREQARNSGLHGFASLRTAPR